MTVDVTDPDAVERAADAAIEHFGKLHVAVNNAGIVVQGNSWELPLSEWHRVIDVDLWGVIHGIHSFVPRILASGEPGHVVNTASMAAVTAIPGIGPYTASKHAVLGLSDGLRAELAAIDAPVGVSVVMPGMIKTALNPLGTVEPDQVAANVSTPSVSVAPMCSPTTTTSRRSSRASARSWRRGPTWCRSTTRHSRRPLRRIYPSPSSDHTERSTRFQVAITTCAHSLIGCAMYSGLVTTSASSTS